MEGSKNPSNDLHKLTQKRSPYTRLYHTRSDLYLGFLGGCSRKYESSSPPSGPEVPEFFTILERGDSLILRFLVSRILLLCSLFI